LREKLKMMIGNAHYAKKLIIILEKLVIVAYLLNKIESKETL
jgi:hypothetical protein